MTFPIDGDLYVTGKTGLGIEQPQERLEVNGNIKATSFQGDGSNLTGVVKNLDLAVKKAGDTMTGALTIQNGLNVTGASTLNGGLTVTGICSPSTWIASNFGVQQGNRVVLGTYKDKATIGAHNNTLSAWSDLILQTDGGNVGIGTSTPNAKLDVNGNVSLGSLKVNQRMSVTQGVIQRGGDPITTTADLGLYSQLDGHWMRFVTKNAPFQFFSDGGAGTNPIFIIEPSGDVKATSFLGDGSNLTGVVKNLDLAVKKAGDTMTGALTIQNGLNVTGASTLNGGLTVTGTCSTSSWIVSNLGVQQGNRVVLGTYKDKATIGAHNSTLSAWSDLILQTDGGNVGIGTTNPNAKLDVNGNLKTTTLTIGNTQIGETELKILKALADGSLEVDLYNVKQDEYMYAADYAPYDNDRRRVFTWRPKGRVNQGQWRLHYPTAR
jgi:predicted RNA-binding protein